MILRNNGKSTIYYTDRGADGAALPEKNFQVSDPMGAYLKKLYPKQIENLEDAVKKFQDAKVDEPTVAKVVAAKKSAYQIMLEEQAKAADPAKADDEALEKLTRPAAGGASNTRK